MPKRDRTPRPPTPENELRRELESELAIADDVPDGDHASLRASILAVWDAKTRTHRRPRRRNRRLLAMNAWIMEFTEAPPPVVRVVIGGFARG